MKTQRRNMARTLVMVYSLGFEILVTVALGFFLGRYLDGKLNTNPWFTVSLMLLFMFAAMYRLIRRVIKLEDSNGQK